MRALLRDKDFMLVFGCLVAGVLQVVAQRNLLRAVQAAAARDAARRAAGPAPHKRHQPMRYADPVMQQAVDASPLRDAFGMN